MPNETEIGIQKKTIVRLSDGGAEIRTGGKSFGVFRKDAGEGEGVCPVDLIAGALGS